MEQQCSFAGLPEWLLQVCVMPSAAMAAEAKDHVDAIHLAAEVGRLDVISFILGALTIVLAIGALLGFWVIRGAAMSAAKEEAKRVAEQEAVPEARRAATSWFQSQGIDWQKLATLAPLDKASNDQSFADALSEDGKNGDADPGIR